MSGRQSGGQVRYNRYEKARILGARALQVSYGAPVLIGTDQSEPILVAAEEYDAGVLPFTGAPRGSRAAMSRAHSVELRRILDSRGNATVEADVLTEDGGFGRAAAPAGASTGAYEAVELPPGEAIAAARRLAVPRLEGTVHAGDQRAVDATLRGADGTDDLSEIGANAVVAISMAVAKAAADTIGVPLYQHLGGALRGPSSDSFPVPLGNVVGGGEHARDATDIQEFLAVPVGAPNVVEAAFANARVHGRVGDLFDDHGITAGKGDEGAWAPQTDDATAFEIVDEAIETVADDLGFEIRMGLDVAATELVDDDGVYRYTDVERTPDEQVDYVACVRRGPTRRGGVRRLRGADRPGRVADGDLWRRPGRHERRATPAWHRRRRRQQHPDQAESDRDAHRRGRRYQPGGRERVHTRHLASLGRDRRHHHRPSRCRHRRAVRQDRCGRGRADGKAERADPDSRRRSLTS